MSHASPNHHHAKSTRRIVWLLFFHSFCNAAAYVATRTVADSLFLSHVGPRQLPAMYLVCAAFLAMLTAAYARLACALPTVTSVRTTRLCFAGLSVVFAISSSQFPDSLISPALVYLLAQVRGVLGTIQHATLVTEQLGDEQRESWLGAIGFGATLAGFLVGIGAGAAANQFSIAWLLAGAAVIDIAVLLPLQWLPNTAAAGDDAEAKPDETDDEGQLMVPWRQLTGRGEILSILGIVAACIVVTTFVEFQWKVAVADSYGRHERSMTAYFGYFYGTVYLITGVLQLVMLNRVLRWLGPLPALLAFPVSLTVCSVGILLASAHTVSLWIASLAKGCDAFRRSMYDPALLMVYGSLPSPLRQTTIALMSGVVKPLAEAAAGISLLALSWFLTNRQLSMVTLLLLLFWFALIPIWHREHGRQP